jgi:Uma2 family endonuclease
MAVERKLMTADEPSRLRDDGMRHELIDRQLTTMPPPGGEHDRAGGWSHYHIAHNVATNRLGDVLPAETGLV